MLPSFSMARRRRRSEARSNCNCVTARSAATAARVEGWLSHNANSSGDSSHSAATVPRRSAPSNRAPSRACCIRICSCASSLIACLHPWGRASRLCARRRLLRMDYRIQTKWRQWVRQTCTRSRKRRRLVPVCARAAAYLRCGRNLACRSAAGLPPAAGLLTWRSRPGATPHPARVLCAARLRRSNRTARGGVGCVGRHRPGRRSRPGPPGPSRRGSARHRRGPQARPCD